MKILISCYSFGAGKGSEPGVGWNVAVELAKKGHDVTVITTNEFSEINSLALSKLEYSFRIIEWGCGLSDFHLAKTYKKWQKKVLPKVVELTQREDFDLIHHVTFNQYRSLLFIMKTSLPYLVGPVGGGETIPIHLIKELPFREKLKELLRYLKIDVLPLRFRAARSKNKGIFLTSSPETYKRLKKWGNLDVRISKMIGIDENEIIRYPHTFSEKSPFFIFAGRLVPSKGLNLVMKALSLLWKENILIPLHIIGAGNEQQQQEIIKLQEKLGLPEESIQITPFIERKKLLKIFSEAKAFIYTGFRDSGSMAVLEALASGAIPICFNLSGQHWLPDELSIKLEAGDADIVKHILEGMKKSLELTHIDSLNEKRYNFLMTQMTWRKRIEEFEALYNELLSK